MPVDRDAVQSQEPDGLGQFPDTDTGHVPEKNLGRTTRAGARWQGLSQGIEFGSSMAIMLLLAHYVSPSDFGFVAFGTAAVGLLSGILVSPVSTAVVAKQLSAEAPLDTAWWMAVGPCAVLYIAAVSTASLLGMHGLGFGVLVGIGASLPLTAVMQVLTAHLQQQLEFRKLSLTRMVGSVGSTACAFGLLAMGEPLTALIVRTALAPLLQGLAMLVGASWWPRLRIDRRVFREILAYARGMAGFNTVNQFARKGDDIIVGGLVNAHALGLYSIAYRFIEVPVGQVGQVAQNVAFPALVRVKDEKRMRTAFLRSQRLLVWLVAPVSIASVALGDLAVPAFLGSNWHEAGPIVQIFGAIAFLQSAGTQAGIIYLYRSATGLMMRWGMAAASVVLVCFLIGSHWGALGVAWGYLMANLILFYPSWAIPGRLIALRPIVVMRNLLGMLGLALLTVLALIALRHFVSLDGLIPLSLAIIGSSVMFWLLAIALDPALRIDVKATALPGDR